MPSAARACPECGSDEQTGWSDDAEAWAGELPAGQDDDEDFDYEQALRAEGLAEDGRPSREARRRRRVAVASALLIGCILLWLFLR